MRTYFDKAAIDDEMLKDNIQQTHIDISSAYIEDLAAGLGITVEQIVLPTPFKVARLAEAYALMECAKKLSMMNTSGNVEGADAFELKRRVYAAEVVALEDQITAETLLGGKSAAKRKFPASLKVYRG